MTRVMEVEDQVIEHPTYVYQAVDFINFLTYLLEGILFLRLMFVMVGANPRAGFVQFIRGLSEPFIAPFRGILGTIVANGLTLDPSIVLAMLAYLILTKIVIDLIRIVSERRLRVAI